MSPKVNLKHKEERKNQILNAAFSCFNTLGYQQTTMRDICKEAGLSTGAVYSYFSSKKDIVHALAVFGESKNEEFFNEMDDNLNPFEKIKSAVVGYMRIFDQKEALPSLKVDQHLKAAALQDKDIFVLVQKSLEKRLQSIEKLLSDAKSQKLINDSIDIEITAQILISILAGSITQKLFNPKMDMESHGKGVEVWIENALKKKGIVKI